jgi:broad specificity phosphatase PhoE
MGVLTLVRHGQTAGEWHDRDRLSELGARQATRLGEVWAAAGRPWEAVYVGPARRHQQTYEAVAAAYRARGLSWHLPEPVMLPELDEYAAEPLFRVLLPKLAERDESVREVLAAGALEGPGGERRLFRLLEPLGRAWARGELEDPAMESWSAFTARVKTALGRMARGKKAEAVAFTSAGTMAVATGLALEATAEKTFGLSMRVWNTGCTEFLFSGDRLSLRSFNATPHLTEPDLQTMR